MTELHTLRRTLGVLALLLVAGGCSNLLSGLLPGRPEPARELYRLRMDDATRLSLADANGFAAALQGDLAIRAYTTLGLYGDRGIVFRMGELAYGVYPSREWALPLGEMLGMLTENVMRENPLVSGVSAFEAPSRRSDSYVWRATVLQFEEINRGAEVYVGVSFDVRIIRSIDDSVVWRGRASREVPVPEETMPAIVGALSNLSGQLIAQLIREARNELGSTARAGSP